MTLSSSRLVALLCAASVSLGVAACGGGGSDESPSDVALNFYKALADKDTGKACDYVSSEAKKKADAAGGCEKALDGVVKQTPAAQLASFSSLEASNEKINGDKATVTLKPTARGYANGSQEANLTKEDGDWKLVDFNATGSAG